MEKVEAGIVTDILKKLGSFLSSIFDYAIEKYPNSVKNIKVDSKGVVTFEGYYGGGSVVKVTLIPYKDDEKMYDVTIEPIGGPAKESRIAPYKNKVKYKDNNSLINMLTDYGDKFKPAEGLEDTSNDLLSSTIVKLNKITSSTNISVDIDKIILGSDTLPVPTINNINTILDEEDFIASLPEGESFVAIDDLGDNLEAEILEDYTCENGGNIVANNILYTISKCYATQLYLYAIQCNVVGEGISDVYTLLDGSSYPINDAIRILFDIYRTLTPAQFINMQQVTDDVCECMQFDIGCNMSAQEAKESIYTIYSDYLASLEIMQYNLSDTDFDKLSYTIQNAKGFLGCLQRELYA